MKLIITSFLLLSFSAFAQQAQIRNDIVIAEITNNIDVEKCIEKFHTDSCIIKNTNEMNVVAELKIIGHTIIDNIYGCTVKAVIRDKAMIVYVRSSETRDTNNERTSINYLVMFKDKIQAYKVRSLFYFRK